jgi:hypothetical protein
MRKTFWQKIEEARRNGITTEQFERVENLEFAIAYHQNKIDECEKEIMNIVEEGKSMLKRIEV